MKSSHDIRVHSTIQGGPPIVEQEPNPPKNYIFSMNLNSGSSVKFSKSITQNDTACCKQKKDYNWAGGVVKPRDRKQQIIEETMESTT